MGLSGLLGALDDVHVEGSESSAWCAVSTQESSVMVIIPPTLAYLRGGHVGF